MQEFVNNEWTELSFYIDKLSLFMQNQCGIPERIVMWRDILMNVINTSQELIDRLDIFYYKSPSDNYFSKNHVSQSGMNDAVLDLIGSIYGLQRTLILTELSDDPTSTTKSSVTLNNYEFLVYIQAFIAKTTFDGTQENLLQIYTGSPIPHYAQLSDTAKQHLSDTYQESYLTKLQIVYCAGTSPLEATIYMTTNAQFDPSANYDGSGVSDNIKRLFIDGYLTIESLGITYSKTMANIFASGYYMPSSDPTKQGYYDYQQKPSGNVVYLYGGDET